jgi:hypothetical protein
MRACAVGIVEFLCAFRTKRTRRALLMARTRERDRSYTTSRPVTYPLARVTSRLAQFGATLPSI